MKNLFRIVGLILLIFLIHSCETDDANVIKDVDDNVYTSVTIGNQVWMVENLKTTKYSNGDIIGTTIPTTLNISGESTPKYQWAYDDIEVNVATYGRLYTWYAVTDNRNICPTGWHVPTDTEWITLTTYLGGTSIAGGKLKETGTAHWPSPNTGATNETGFTALPAGTRYIDGTFSSIGGPGGWWSATEYDAASAWNRAMRVYSSSVESYYSSKKYGCSVRCLKN